MNKNELLVVKEVADILRLNPHSVYNMISKAKGYTRFPIKAVRIGRNVRFRRKDVEAFVNQK